MGCTNIEVVLEALLTKSDTNLEIGFTQWEALLTKLKYKPSESNVQILLHYRLANVKPSPHKKCLANMLWSFVDMHMHFVAMHKL